MKKIRVGSVRYLNTMPLVEGLSGLESVELSPAVPSRLIDLLLGRKVDIALVSSIDAALSPEPLVMIPCGMIGCDGPTLTVRVFSKIPLSEISTVHADTDSHTSSALCRVIFQHRFDREIALVDFDARERVTVSGDGDAPEAMLLIGDKVVVDPPPEALYPHQLDLGSAWHELTGLPFVYAVWMCRAENAEDATIRSAGAILDRQRLHNAGRLDWIVSTRAPEFRWPIEIAREYLIERLRYAVGAREREAVSRFFKETAALGINPRCEPVWMDGVVSSSH